MAAGIGKYGPPPGLAGGETGIRTLGTLSRTHAFQACALSRSAISPATGGGEYQTRGGTGTLNHGREARMGRQEWGGRVRGQCEGATRRRDQASILRAARKADCGISTLPNWRMRFLP